MPASARSSLLSKSRCILHMNLTANNQSMHVDNYSKFSNTLTSMLIRKITNIIKLINE